jgi:hypothetical protein
MGNGRHYSDDELILYYYGEGRAARHGVPRHLDACDTCRAAYAALVSTLALAPALEAPERSDQYGLEVWQRIRHQLPEQDEPWWALTRWLLDLRAAGLTATALVVAAFIAGRFWPAGPSVSRQPAVAIPLTAGNRPARGDVDAQARRRILLSAVADHLDRSERVLTDLMNAEGRDISFEQHWADDLLASSRVYRQDAQDVGEPLVADVLDAIERSLLELVHSPSHISAAALERLRDRIDAASLLFKVRVLSDELRERNALPLERPVSDSSATSPS